MNYHLVQTNSGTYLELFASPTPLSTEQDALDLLALCGEHDTNLLMLHGTALSPDFFELKTRVAGLMLQKFINYSMKVAVLITPEQFNYGRFAEMARESASSNQIRFFTDPAAAHRWLGE